MLAIVPLESDPPHHVDPQAIEIASLVPVLAKIDA